MEPPEQLSSTEAQAVKGRNLTVITEMPPVRASGTAEVAFFSSLAGQLHLEPRCRICRNDHMREKVNGMLAAGLTYGSILRALEEDNAALEQRQRVTIDSVRNHTARHFPVQNVAQATYRAILERRAQENGIDFIHGVATAITPMALFESVMVKGYQTLADTDTKVDVNTAMIAAGRLQALIDARANGTSMAEILVKMDRIINAIQSTVPEEMWGEILSKIDPPASIDMAAEEHGDCVAESPLPFDTHTCSRGSC